MNILHAHTDPNLLTRLKEMLGGANRADIGVGYVFMSGFETVADELSQLNKTRILIGHTNRPTLEAVVKGNDRGHFHPWHSKRRRSSARPGIHNDCRVGSDATGPSRDQDHRAMEVCQTAVQKHLHITKPMPGGQLTWH